MKRISILVVALLLCVAGFAQRIKNIHEQSIPYINTSGLYFSNSHSSTARITGLGDTLTLIHIASTDTLTYYTADSGGYVNGTNAFGDQAFAERYDITGNDSSVQVLGVFALFGGTVNPASPQTINFNIWNQTYAQPITGSLYYNGFPATALISDTVAVTSLGIGTLQAYMFTTPSPVMSGPFFAGYGINYLFDTVTGKTTNGDNIGLASSKNGERYGAHSIVQTNVYAGVDTTQDTVLNVQNATLGSDNTWYDDYTQNDSLNNNLAIYPIVVIGQPNGVKNITRNGLTFFGNYPNPAVSYTNISFSLASGADVTLLVMDMAGHVVNKTQQNNLSAGAHTILLPTADMPAGDYLYLIRTSNGDGVAGKMSKVF